MKPHCSPHPPVLPLILVSILLGPLTAGPAHAEDLDQLKQEARELVDQLRRELDDVRRERRALDTERKALDEERRTIEAQRDAAPAAPAPAELATTAGTAAVVAETDRKVGVLAREVQTLKEKIVLPEDKELKSFYGLGPAASKVYQVSRGLSIGGYGEGNFSGKVKDVGDDHSTADFLRFVLYTGYKFTDRILLNAEMELEHATTGSTVSSSDGAFSLEFAYLDFLLSDYANVRTGLFLAPLGFVNQIHEPVYFFGNNRPALDRDIIPTTWRNLGVGLFGNLHEDVRYEAYLSTGLNAKGFSSSGIRGGRQKGNDVRAEDPAGNIRLDYAPHQVPGSLVGMSTFFGDSGQHQDFAGDNVSAFLSLFDVHAQYQHRGLWLRGVAAFGSLDDAEQLSVAKGEPIADRFQGWYMEAGYDVMPHLHQLLPDHLPASQYVAPFFRFEHIDPQQSVPSGFERDKTKEFDLYTVGVSYKPHPQVVFKLDYRNFVQRSGNRPDEINLGLGFVF
jgi:hypothetical protein